MDQITVERFWERVQKTKTCWVWIGNRYSNTDPLHSYGRLWVHGKAVRAHYISWIIHNGKFPPGKILCHKCDNPPCVRPSHMWLGTHKENHQDRSRKGRNKHPKGEAVGNSKLKEKDIPEIRKMLSKGITQFLIAQKFGVSRENIGRIKIGKSWTWLK